MTYPRPTPIFHITSIQNLEKILNSGELLAKTVLDGERRDYCNIAYADLQNRRSRVRITRGEGGTLHDYVPFYFAPRSPMLDAIRRGLVAGCNEPQENILHLMTYAETIDAAALPYVFTNGHAIMQPLEIFDSLNDIDKVDWEILLEYPRIGGYAQYWHDNLSNPQKPKWFDRKRRRQAEFLVHQRLPWRLIKGVGTINITKAAEVDRIIKRFELHTPVQAKPEWYLL